ncbi:EexN family lipoprotein [Massilia soli]|uniref:EexN family lipoprotein n=1 Tax=Massilia soli TaxID=2792854 RepID=A0ABS7SLU6_9BURK|nr:EexN family lipoprotein [Massilia soli]
MKSIILGFIATMFLIACEPTRDVAFYRDNPEEREAKLQVCQSNPGGLGNDRECISAWNALEVKPVSYWRAHRAERGVITSICRDHKATFKNSPNCENALAAQAAVMGGGKPVYIPLKK